MMMDQVDDMPEYDEELPTPDPSAEADTDMDTDTATDAEPIDLDVLQSRAAEADALADKLKRVEAGFVNEAKRIRRQAEQDRKYAIEELVVEMLPVVDALQGARDGLADDEASAGMREGLGLIEKQLATIFERHGIEPIEAEGKPFDPSRHQAMLMIENADLEPQTVCEVLRIGYELKGRVVRPAEVVVVKGKAAATPEEDDDPSGESEDGASDAGQDDGAGRDED